MHVTACGSSGGAPCPTPLGQGQGVHENVNRHRSVDANGLLLPRLLQGRIIYSRARGVRGGGCCCRSQSVQTYKATVFARVISRSTKFNVIRDTRRPAGWQVGHSSRSTASVCYGILYVCVCTDVNPPRPVYSSRGLTMLYGSPHR